MEIYKFIELENNSIYLEKVTINKDEYEIIYEESGNILLNKLNIINIDDIKKYNFSKSSIIDCKVNDKSLLKLKYKRIIEYIYNLIDNGTRIIKNSNLNIKTIKKEDEGFHYYSNLGISVQAVDSNRSLNEIINQCKCNNIKLYMNIKLYNKENIIINL